MNSNTRVTSIKRQNALSKIVLYSLLISLSVICMAPFLFMLAASFKSMEDVMSFPMPVFTSAFTGENYVTLFQDYQFLKIVWNSFYIAVVYTLMTIYFSAMGGYALAKFRFKGSGIIFGIALASLMVPFESIMIPLYITYRKLGLINSHIAIMIPEVSRIAFGVFFMRQFISGGVSTEIMESARIDGCGEFRIFNQMVLPILKPGFATLGIIFFMASWNNYLWPLIVLNSPAKMTIPIALKNFQQAGGSHTPPYHLLMAGAVVSIVPMMLAFFSLQKYFIAGISAGAVKE